MILIQSDTWLCCDGKLVCSRWAAYQHEKAVGTGACSPAAYRHAERSHMEHVRSKESGTDWIKEILRKGGMR